MTEIQKIVSSLLAIARAAHTALDDSEERMRGDGSGEKEHVISADNFANLEAHLASLDNLPEAPNTTMTGPMRAEYALRELLASGVGVPLAIAYKKQRDDMLKFMENAQVSSGVCCCGDNMDKHSNEHGPVDMWDHSVICWRKDIEKFDTEIDAKLGLCQDEGCPHHGTPHVCLNLDNAAMPLAEPRTGIPAQWRDQIKLLKWPDPQPESPVEKMARDLAGTEYRSVRETMLAMRGLNFNDLRAANIARLPLFKNCHGEPAHSMPDGSDWTPSDWLEAVTGELGEYANFHKKFRRGDITFEEFQMHAAKELADTQTYLDILAMRCLDLPGRPHPTGINLGQATVDKFNEVSRRVGCEVFLLTPANVMMQERVIRDANTLQQLREICGYIENGGGDSVTIAQDDATGEWALYVGRDNELLRTKRRSYSAQTFHSVIHKAREKEGDKS